jgi:hypothetical protein
MDNYSTEHFQSIHQFRVQGYYYLLLSFCIGTVPAGTREVSATLVSLLLYYKHLRTPRDEHKLVSNYEVLPAVMTTTWSHRIKQKLYYTIQYGII